MKDDMMFRTMGDIDPTLLDNFEVSLNKYQEIPKKKKSVGRKIGFSSLAMASLFVLMVNVSPTFALACSQIPFLDKLAQAVNFSYSLSRAVEEEFVQYIGKSHTENGITLTLEHLIVDQRELHLFIDLTSPEDSSFYPEVFLPELGELGMRGGYVNRSPDNLCQVSFSFEGQEMPSKLDMVILSRSYDASVRTNPAFQSLEEEKIMALIPDFEPLNSFDWYLAFPLTVEFDPYFTQQGRIYEVNQHFTVNQQKFSIETLEVFPTHMKMNLLQDASNEKQLVELSFSLLNETGETLAGERFGSRIFYPEESPEVIPISMESDFFDQSEHITFQIEETSWRKRENSTPVEFHLNTREIKNLPSHLEVLSSEEKEEVWEVNFFEKNNPLYPTLNNKSRWNPFQPFAINEKGEEFYLNGGGGGRDSSGTDSWYYFEKSIGEIAYVYLVVEEFSNEMVPIPLF